MNPLHRSIEQLPSAPCRSRRLSASRRRALVLLVSAGSTFAAAGTASAESAYPSKAVTVIVPQAPGGANDAVARLVLERVGKQLGQAFVIDNRAGAGGNVGIQAAARSGNDGYTLLLTVGSSLTINPSIYKKVPFDPKKDFEPIAMIATAPYVLVANSKLPVNTVAELIAMAKDKPGQVDYASGGNGTPNHLFAELFNLRAGIKLNHVPYKGATAAAADVVSGRVPVTFGSLPGVMSFVKSGRLKAIAVATPKRSDLLPGVPAISETVPGYAADSWYALFAPAGTPKEVTSKLRESVAAVLKTKDVQDALALQGAEAPPDLTTAQIDELIGSELALWARVVKESGATVD